MSNLPLKALVWDVDEYTGEPESRGLLHSYIVMNDGDSKIKVAYYLLSGGTRTKFATGFATVEDAKEWAWNHYNEKMQPYVKPMPTWIDVNERLPEEDGLYLAHYPDQPYKQQIVFFSSNIDKFNLFHELITHWMPIPEFSEVTK